MPRIDLADGRTGKHSGHVDVERTDKGVKLEFHKHHTVTIVLPPTLARQLGELLVKEAGPRKPDLSIVKENS